MERCVVACDFGTGGLKAAVFDAAGRCIAERVAEYKTFYPAPSRHEQRPEDWWAALSMCIPELLGAPGVERSAISAIAISGHSLGCIPLSADGALLEDSVPIWSDGRAEAEAAAFFAGFDETAWYRITGNGFPAPLYPLFKLLWLRRHRPDALARAHWIVGTKDYINFRLTGRIATDHSYASGSGFYDLIEHRYADAILDAAELDASLMPQPIESTAVLGEVSPAIAEVLGLPPGVKVVAGGVDNSCMALGAGAFREGAMFSAMGSSSWLTVSSAKPLLDDRVRPYVFTHVAPGFYISATSIFASGSSLAWVRNTLLPDVAAEAEAHGRNDYEALMQLAAAAPRGRTALFSFPLLAAELRSKGGPACAARSSASISSTRAPM
jgi:xylulokinase